MKDFGTLERIIFGIRHERTFHVLDVLGNIVDVMKPLQGTESFPSACFKTVIRTNDTVVLRDSEKDYSVSLAADIDGIVLECDMLTDPPTQPKQVIDMFTTSVNYILPLYEGTKRINRLGVIHRFMFPSDGNAAAQMIKGLLRNEPNGYPDSAILRIVLKHPTAEAVQIPDKSGSYKNVILEIKSKKDSESNAPSFLEAAIDYQVYYDPEQPLSKVSITQHAEEAYAYIASHIKGKMFDFLASQAAHGKA